MFFDWAACNFGWSSVCGSKFWTHAIAFAFVAPLCLPGSLGVFSVTSMAAAAIILFAVNLIMGYQYVKVFEDGINSSTNWFKPLRLGQFYGVASFAIEGIGLILPIRATMRDYKGFRWLFHLIGAIVVAWYFFFGMSGAMVALAHIAIRGKSTWHHPFWILQDL